MTSRALSKYLAFSRLGWAEAWAERAELYAKLLYLPVVLGIFSALWRAVGGPGSSVGAAPKSLVWYLATTEWVFFSVAPIHFRVAEEIRRGDVAYQLGRPVSYLGAHFARGLGKTLQRAPIIALVVAGTATLFVGPPDATPRELALSFALGLGSCVLWLAFYLLLGIATFWVEDVNPLHWVWNKLAFVFGGLMLPLPYCPEAVRRIGEFTPFPSLLYAPASLQLTDLSARSSSMFGAMAFWFAFAALLGAVGFRRARSRLTVNGG